MREKNTNFKIYLLAIFYIAFAMIIVAQFLCQYDAPSVEEQKRYISQEIKKVDIDKNFQAINGCSEFFSKQKYVSCSGTYYLNKDIANTLNKFIELHKKNDWIVDKVTHNYEVIMRKNKMRVYATIMKGKIYGLENYPNNYVEIKYAYIDGWVEKEKLPKY